VNPSWFQSLHHLTSIDKVRYAHTPSSIVTSIGLYKMSTLYTTGAPGKRAAHLSSSIMRCLPNRKLPFKGATTPCRLCRHDFKAILCRITNIFVGEANQSCCQTLPCCLASGGHLTKVLLPFVSTAFTQIGSFTSHPHLSPGLRVLSIWRTCL